MVRGAGLGWRSELAGDLLRRPSAVDFVEVVAETCFVNAAMRREACAIGRVWPVVPHGVKLSLGSAAGIDVARARQLGALARELRAPMVSEHVAFVRAGGREIGHLTPLPRTMEAVQVVARNVDVARRSLPDVPLLLENVAATIAWPEDAMDEASFYQEIVAATGCALLLDLGNLFANAWNDGRDAMAVLQAYPLEHVAMVHLAGGELEHGFWFDTHAGPVRAEVWALLEAFARVRPGVPVMVERDAGFGRFEDLAAEVERARTVMAGESLDARPREPAALAEVDATPLDALQAELAVALSDVAEPDAIATARFGRDALARTRTVLERKRVDDALPLVPRLAARGEPVRALALATIRSEPRAPRAAAIADAIRIADAATQHPALAAAARLDRLVLRARFVGPDRTGVMRLRAGPFVGRTDRTWALKSLGASSNVHLIERKP